MLVVTVHEEKKLFQCDECEMLKDPELENSAEDFASERDLESHNSLYHSEKPLETAMNIDQEMQVVSVHEGKKPFQCDKCEMLKDPELENSAEDIANDHLKGHNFEHPAEKPLETAMNFDQEMQVVTVHKEKKPFQCENLVKSSKVGLESLEKGLTPMRDHLITLPFNCPICGIHFNSKKILDKHILTVHLAYYMPMRYGQKLFKCDICNEGFVLKQTLELHMLSKHGSVHEVKKQSEAKASRPLKLLKYSKKGDLKSQILAVHEGTKPLRCNHCGAMFATKYNLKQHMIVHEEKRPIIMNFKGKKRFHCQFCPAKFCVKRMLKKHISAVHEEKKPNERSGTDIGMVKVDSIFEVDDDEIPDFD